MRHRAGRNSVSIFESMDAQYSCTFLASCQGDLDTGIVHSKCRRLPLHAFWHFTVDMHSGGSVLYRTPIPFSLVLFPFSLFHFPFSDEHIRKGCLLRIPNSKFEIPVTGGNHLTDVSHIYRLVSHEISSPFLLASSEVHGCFGPGRQLFLRLSRFTLGYMSLCLLLK